MYCGFVLAIAALSGPMVFEGFQKAFRGQAVAQASRIMQLPGFSG